MKNCPNPNCKRAISEHALYCPYCGKTIDEKDILTTTFYIGGITFLTIAVFLFLNLLKSDNHRRSIKYQSNCNLEILPISVSLKKDIISSQGYRSLTIQVGFS
jgi:hypothetical protein